MPELRYRRQRTQRAVLLEWFAGSVLVTLLLGLGLFAHAVAGQPAVRTATTQPAAAAFDGPAPATATLAPARPLTGGALTIYIVDSRSQAVSLQDAIQNDPCRLSRVPTCMDVLLIVSATDLDPAGSWLPRQYGQVLTPLDLRGDALAGPSASPDLIPLYHLVGTPGAGAPVGQTLAGGTPAEAAQAVLTLSTQNARRVSQERPPAAVIDER